MTGVLLVVCVCAGVLRETLCAVTEAVRQDR